MTATSTGVVYGPPKHYKTSMLAAAFPRALFIGSPPAIRLVVENELGFTPVIWPFDVDGRSAADVYGLPSRVETLDDLCSILQMLDEYGYNGVFDAIINDDLTPIAMRSIQMWKRQDVRTASGAVDNFYPYQQLSGRVIDVAGLTRNLGCHAWSSAWQREPSVDIKTRKRKPGGPNIGTADQSAQLPGWFDVNVRAVIDPNYPDPWIKGALLADVSSVGTDKYVTGDRNGVVINNVPAPPNIREILRASRTNYLLTRPEGLEWLDELAEELAGLVDTHGARSAEAWDFIEHAFGGSVPVTPRTQDELHIRWGCQDGIARGILRRQVRMTTVSREAFMGASPSQDRRPRSPASSGKPET